MSIADLIARLEQASEPDRELDAAIDVTLRIGNSKLPEWAWKNFQKWGPGPTAGRVQTLHANGIGGLHWESDRFTTSIDAALKTLEPGWEFTISTIYGVADVELPLNDTRISPVQVRNPACDVPVAICIAALKARLALSHSQG